MIRGNQRFFPGKDRHFLALSTASTLFRSPPSPYVMLNKNSFFGDKKDEA
jgi:hypothetical protein